MRKKLLTIMMAAVLVALIAAPASAASYYPTRNWQSTYYSRLLCQYYNARWPGSCPTPQPAPAPAPSPAPMPSPAPQPQPQPAPAPAPAPAPTPVPGLNADEQYILEQVNVERAKVGLRPLQIDMRIVETARAKSRDMINNNYFGHTSPTMGSPFDQLRAAGISYRYAGENIAGAGTAQRAMQMWMESPGHRANILKAEYTHIGIGVVNGGPYGKMLTQHFIQK